MGRSATAILIGRRPQHSCASRDRFAQQRYFAETILGTGLIQRKLRFNNGFRINAFYLRVPTSLL